MPLGGIGVSPAKPAAFIQARAFNRNRQARIRLVVIHTMESPEKPGTARAVAQWFASPSGPAASAHYCVDESEIIQCVGELDVAWGAPGANADGLHVEHAGRASFTREQWTTDPGCVSVLAQSALLVAGLCVRWGLPIVKLGPDGVRSGEAGICGHIDVTRAWPGKGTHTDPGDGWPWDTYIQQVQFNATRLPPMTQPPGGVP